MQELKPTPLAVKVETPKKEDIKPPVAKSMIPVPPRLGSKPQAKQQEEQRSSRKSTPKRAPSPKLPPTAQIQKQDPAPSPKVGKSLASINKGIPVADKKETHIVAQTQKEPEIPK